MFWLDRNRYEGALILYINEEISCKILTDQAKIGPMKTDVNINDNEAYA